MSNMISENTYIKIKYLYTQILEKFWDKVSAKTFLLEKYSFPVISENPYANYLLYLEGDVFKCSGHGEEASSILFIEVIDSIRNPIEKEIPRWVHEYELFYSKPKDTDIETIIDISFEHQWKIIQLLGLLGSLIKSYEIKEEGEENNKEMTSYDIFKSEDHYKAFNDLLKEFCFEKGVLQKNKLATLSRLFTEHSFLSGPTTQIQWSEWLIEKDIIDKIIYPKTWADIQLETKNKMKKHLIDFHPKV